MEPIVDLRVDYKEDPNFDPKLDLNLNPYVLNHIALNRLSLYRSSFRTQSVTSRRVKKRDPTEIHQLGGTNGQYFLATDDEDEAKQLGESSVRAREKRFLIYVL